MKLRENRLWMLFREMFLLAALVLGGGYVILAVAEERFSRKFGWTKPGELIGMLPVFQMVPGIIGGHTAVYLGSRVAGMPGAAVALAGMALPSVAIFLAIALLYRNLPLDGPVVAALFAGLRAAITGVMLSVTVRSWRASVAGAFGHVALALGTLALAWLDVPPWEVIVVAMAAGIALTYHRTRETPPDGGARTFRSFWAIPLVFLGYGLIAFGGGFVLVPVYLRDFVGESARFLQLAPADFANVIALTQLSPGPVAINGATYFGYAMGGVAGALVATLALLLPGSLILLVALKSLERFKASVVVRGLLFGVRPVTTAMLLSATWALARLCVWSVGADGGFSLSLRATMLAAVSFAAVHSRRLGAIPTILAAAALSALSPL